METKKTKTVIIRITDEEVAALDAYCKNEGRTRSNGIRYAVYLMISKANTAISQKI